MPFDVILSVPMLVSSGDRRVKAASRLSKLNGVTLHDEDFVSHLEAPLSVLIEDNRFTLRYADERVWLDICYRASKKLGSRQLDALCSFTWDILLDGVSGFEVGKLFAAVNALGSVADVVVRQQKVQSAPESSDAANAGLLRAAKRGSLVGVKKAIARGASIDARDKHGRTVLHLAIGRFCEHKELAKALLDLGASPHLMDQSGITPLLAVMSCHGYVQMDLVEELIRCGAEPDQANHVHGHTPLFEAARHGELAAVEYFLGLGADINHQDAQGRTAAMRTLDPDVLRCLIERGIDLNLENAEGQNLEAFLQAKRDENAVSEYSFADPEPYERLLAVPRQGRASQRDGPRPECART